MDVCLCARTLQSLLLFIILVECRARYEKHTFSSVFSFDLLFKGIRMLSSENWQRAHIMYNPVILYAVKDYSSLWSLNFD